MNYNFDSAVARHTRALPKPCEDCTLVDTKHKILFLMDGITRNHDEYFDAPETSAAKDVTTIFVDAAHTFLCEHMDNIEDKEVLLRSAAAEGNRKIYAYRAQHPLEEWRYYPATLGILALLDENVLHYLCCGDCIGVLLRRSSRLLFGRQLTLQAVDKMKVTKQERYARYCNHPEEPLFYTVYNGDEMAETRAEYSYFDLRSGDTILLASDGIGQYLKYTDADTLRRLSPKEMLTQSVIYDEQPFAEYGDDKAVIKISITS